jgi:hypothetical protein
MVEPERPHMTIRGMRVACWITKTTDTHSKYVMLVAFPWQQWFRERASMLCYTHTSCLSYSIMVTLTLLHHYM